MWSCPLCNQEFKNTHQTHYCSDQTVSDFLIGKSDKAIELYQHFAKFYTQISDIKAHATKSMIAFKAAKNFAYVIKLGKEFIDIVFSFKIRYADNLCFTKIVQVPGTNDYNHYLRIYAKEDVNEEVKHYMQLAYANGKTI